MMSDCGRYRVHIASMTNTPAARAAAAISTPSASDMANGFSTRTCLPAAIACSATSRCAECGVPT